MPTWILPSLPHQTLGSIKFVAIYDDDFYVSFCCASLLKETSKYYPTATSYFFFFFKGMRQAEMKTFVVMDDRDLLESQCDFSGVILS